ncbi:MAG TPA: ABC transporter ATP-binding protein [Phycisphaerales bacterium]|nr:ABC transporter ATP-binding protein [Phycisphaerales bacterium]
MIRCRGVTKSYRLPGRVVTALRGADLEITEPGFYGIMGASGSGKSTLLHLLGALDKPDAGEVVVSGRRLHELDERALTRFRGRAVGIVFQQYNLVPTLTARQNVELPGLLQREPKDWLRRRAGELLAALGVPDRADHRPDALSGGEQQRVAIARALLFAPRVLLADEPTGSLDSVSSARLWELLRALAAEHGMGVVMVTHEPAAAIHCRRVMVLSDGRVTGEIETEGLDAAGVAARYQQLVRPA